MSRKRKKKKLLKRKEVKKCSVSRNPFSEDAERSDLKYRPKADFTFESYFTS